MTQLYLTFMVEHAANNFRQRGLTLAIASHKGNLLPSRNQQVDVFEDDLVAIRLAHMIQFQRHLARMRRRGKLEVDGRAVDVVNDDFIHLFEQLHTALHLFGLGRLVAEPLDERLYILDFALLVLVGRALHVDTLLTQADILGIRHLVVIDFAIRDFHRADGDVVQEGSVVRNHQDSTIIGFQEAFEPLDGLDVEVVGGLVEKQEIRLFQQDFGQLHAHLPAVAELAHRAQHVLVAEAQADQNPFRLAFNAIATEQGQAVVQVVQLNYQLLVLRAFVVGAVGQFLLQALRITF